MTVLIDSDILIEVSRGRDKSLAEAWMNLAAQDALTLYSPISVAELWAGARPSEYTTIQALFDSLVCLPVTAEIGRRAGEFLNRHRKSHSVEIADAIIAAGAVEAGAMLWTRNRKHYPMKELRFFLSPS